MKTLNYLIYPLVGSTVVLSIVLIGELYAKAKSGVENYLSISNCTAQCSMPSDKKGEQYYKTIKANCIYDCLNRN